MQEKDKLQTGGGDTSASKGSSGKKRASYETMDLSMISSVINEAAEDIIKEEEEAAQKAAAAAKERALAEAAELEHYSMAMEQIVASVEAETTGVSGPETAGEPEWRTQESGPGTAETEDFRAEEAFESDRAAEQAAGGTESAETAAPAETFAQGLQDTASVAGQEDFSEKTDSDAWRQEDEKTAESFSGQEGGFLDDRMTAADVQEAVGDRSAAEEAAGTTDAQEDGAETFADAQANAEYAQMAAEETPGSDADAQADAEIARMAAAAGEGPETSAAAAAAKAPRSPADGARDSAAGSLDNTAAAAVSAKAAASATEQKKKTAKEEKKRKKERKKAERKEKRKVKKKLRKKRKKREKRHLTPEQRKKRRKRRLFFLAAVVVVLLVLLLIAALYYKNHWYPNTVINGQDYSGMTIGESEEDLETLVSSYKLTLVGRNGATDTITAEEISLEADVSEVLEELFETQHETFFLSSLFGSADESVEYNLSYDTDALYEQLTASVLVTGSDSYAITEPVSASLSWSEEEGRVVITEADYGNVLAVESAAVYLQAAVESLETEVDFSDEELYPDAYEQPEYTSASAEVQQAQLTWNSYVLHWIVWDMGEDTTEELTPTEIAQWITVSEDYEVTLDTDALGDWLEELCLKYKTYGTTRNFTTHSGEVIQISGGDYGWRIDYDEIVEQAKEILQGEVDETLLNAYLEDPSEENQEALTSYVEPEWSNTAYQKDYTYFMYDWDPLNYSEVDISEQMVYVYQNGSLVYSCKCVTGLPQDGRDTDTGVWYIKDKKLEYTLTGDDYVTPTKYWVRITWTGIGYHYMARSDWSSWSPSLYLTAGSHGCVNLQLADAEAVYSYVSLYDAVFIHE